MRRKYCAPRRELYFLWLKDIFIDLYARLFYKPKHKNDVISPNPKILIITFGHLGDGLIFSYAFPKIKEKYPNAVIDVLTGEACNAVFAKNPLVRKVINLNHFMTNRKPISFWAKLWNHYQTSRSAIAELKKETYDYSLDIRYSGGVSHYILPFINVKKAFGFGSRGYGGYLEKEFFLPDYEFHNYEMISLLMEQIGVKTTLEDVKPVLPYPQANLADLSQKLKIPSKNIVIFPEAGEPIKMLSVEFWEKLTRRILNETDANVMFCGEKNFANDVCTHLKSVFLEQSERILTAGKLNLSELPTLTEASRVTITMDSFPAHLCSIFAPTIMLSQHAGGRQFFPIGNKEILVIHDKETSRNETLKRLGFRAVYQPKFDENVIDLIMDSLKKYT